MQHSAKLLFAILISLGLSACDSNEPTVTDAPAAIKATASDALDATEEAADEAMGAIDDAVGDMADDAMDDAADALDEITSE